MWKRLSLKLIIIIICTAFWIYIQFLLWKPIRELLGTFSSNKALSYLSPPSSKKNDFEKLNSQPILNSPSSKRTYSLSTYAENKDPWLSAPIEGSETDFNLTFSNLISGNYGKLCLKARRYVHARQLAHELLTFWHDLANKENIPYMLAFGSVLGYARDKSFIPYDHDVDVFVPTSSYDVLAQKYGSFISSPINLEASNFTVVVHPDFKTKHYSARKYYDCHGNINPKHGDLCSFTTLLGRIIHGSIYIDLYATDYIPEYDFVISREYNAYVMKKNILFPRRMCTFMGIKTFCPRDYRTYLLSTYKETDPTRLKPNEKCIGGTYLKQKDETKTKLNPELESFDVKILSFTEFCKRFPLYPGHYTDCWHSI